MVKGKQAGNDENLADLVIYTVGMMKNATLNQVNANKMIESGAIGILGELMSYYLTHERRSKQKKSQVFV